MFLFILVCLLLRIFGYSILIIYNYKNTYFYFNNNKIKKIIANDEMLMHFNALLFSLKNKKAENVNMK